MDKWRWKIQKFLQGRNGADQLSRAAVGLGVVFYVLYVFLRKAIFNWFSMVMLVYGMYRVLSKNILARSEENRIFMRYIQLVKTKFELRKTHKVFLCRRCGKIIRVPKGKGKLEVTCPVCWEKTIIRS